MWKVVTIKAPSNSLLWQSSGVFIFNVVPSLVFILVLENCHYYTRQTVERLPDHFTSLYCLSFHLSVCSLALGSRVYLSTIEVPATFFISLSALPFHCLLLSSPACRLLSYLSLSSTLLVVFLLFFLTLQSSRTALNERIKNMASTF